MIDKIKKQIEKLCVEWNTHSVMRSGFPTGVCSPAPEEVILIKENGDEMRTRQWCPKNLKREKIIARSIRAIRNNEAYGNESGAEGLRFFSELKSYATFLNVELDVEMLQKYAEEKWRIMKSEAEGDAFD